MIDQVRSLALRDVRQAARRRAKAEQAFGDAVVRAASIASQRAVAEAAGLSLGRVNQIIHGNG